MLTKLHPKSPNLHPGMNGTSAQGSTFAIDHHLTAASAVAK